MPGTSLAPTRWNGREIEWGRKTLVMAIINATPDSFSGDGIGDDAERAAAMARQAAAEGADLIDLGGESTRPGHAPVSEVEELARVIPAIAAVASAVGLPISVDTSKASVAEAALDAGASIVNDVRGLLRDPELAAVVARRQVPVAIMHDVVPEGSSDLVGNVIRELERRVELAVRAGVERGRIIVDPGFGFGKEWRENLELLNRLDELKALGLPILVGFSRKRTIGRVLGLPEGDRLEGTLATTAVAIARGADIVRVHDVKPNVRVARMTDAVVRGPIEGGA